MQIKAQDGEARNGFNCGCFLRYSFIILLFLFLVNCLTEPNAVMPIALLKSAALFDLLSINIETFGLDIILANFLVALRVANTMQRISSEHAKATKLV